MSNEELTPKSTDELTPGEAVTEAEAMVEVEAEAETPIEPVEIQHAPIEVGLQRSVRFGRILIVGAGLGAILGIIASLFFPVVEGANYELGQIAGLMAVVGAVIGLALGGVLSLVLSVVARRQKGAAIAVQTDVR